MLGLGFRVHLPLSITSSLLLYLCMSRLLPLLVARGPQTAPQAGPVPNEPLLWVGRVPCAVPARFPAVGALDSPPQERGFLVNHQVSF